MVVNWRPIGDAPSDKEVIVNHPKYGVCMGSIEKSPFTGIYGWNIEGLPEVEPPTEFIYFEDLNKDN